MQDDVINNPKEAGRHFTSFLKNGARVASSWQEQNGVIYFSVTSDGTTGKGWIKRLEGKGFHLSDYAKSLLQSKDFHPTSGVTTKVAVLRGILFNDNTHFTKNIRAEAEHRHFIKPNAEAACLIREKFTDEEIKAMGLIWIVVMHEPIKNSDGDPRLLGASRVGDGRWLDTDYGGPSYRWRHDVGFAFAVSQVSP